MIDMVFSFDTTGSMAPCLAQVRRRLDESIGRLLREIDDLHIGIIAHGDYCDNPAYGGRTYDVTTFPLTSNYADLSKYVRSVSKTGGGDAPECYELVLHTAKDFEWREDATKVLVVIGDATPHPVGYVFRGLYRQHHNKLDWRAEARDLAANNIAIYAVQCLGRIGSNSFYRELGSINGYRITLDQFSNIEQTIIAATYKQVSDEQVLAYKEEIKGSIGLNRSLAKIFDLLLDNVADQVSRTDGLIPVPPSRFQAFTIDAPIGIKFFVTDMGIQFNTGRGFYQLTKSVLVQEHKEVVVQDKSTGDMFTGDTARNMIGLPFGKRGRVLPRDVKNNQFDVFIQSKSWNRKLLPRTKFLYEVMDK